MSLYDWPECCSTSYSTSKKEPESLTVTVGIQDRNAVMIALLNKSGKMVTAITLPISEARTLITLLKSAINSLDIDSGVKKEIFD